MSWTKRTDLRYRITPRARMDLIKIGRYTESQWGREKRNHYLQGLHNRFIWLAAYPLPGQHRLDIAAGYYSFPQGQHVIFYLIADTMIDIIGIPHQEMDVITYFSTVSIEGKTER